MYRFYPLHAGEDIPSNDEMYSSKSELREYLISYHEIDWPKEDGDINTLSLDELLEHGQWGLKEIASLHCMACNDGEIEYRSWKSIDVYTCNNCALLGFTYGGAHGGDESMHDLKDFIRFNK